MNTDLDTLTRRMDRLEKQNRRLRFVTFVVWPAAFAVITVFLLLPGKMDLKAMKYLLGSIGGVFVMLVITLFLTMVGWFVLKLATDFKNRHARMPLNPGSRGKSPVGSP